MLIWIDCFQVILVFLLFQPAIKGKYQLNVLGQLITIFTSGEARNSNHNSLNEVLLYRVRR